MARSEKIVLAVICVFGPIGVFVAAMNAASGGEGFSISFSGFVLAMIAALLAGIFAELKSLREALMKREAEARGQDQSSDDE